MAPKLAADPRDAALAVPYSAAMFTPDEAPPDSFVLAAMILGMAGVFLKQRLPTWASLASGLMGLANARGPDNNGMAGLTVALFAFFSVYIAPPPSLPARTPIAAPLPTV
jgi:hypothetical protein